MARIAFILLCHKDPEAVIRQVSGLAAAGDCVAIHYDARAPKADFARLRAALSGMPGVTFARRRVKCGWGEWSLVRATLLTVEAALHAFPQATHLYMLSGDCMAIKTAQHAHRLLDARACDYIESFDFFASDWIKTGWREERLIYRHLVNERTRKRLFYALFHVQKALGLRRAVPRDLDMMIGSQWWCLRRATLERILAFIRARRDIVRFFRTTWIPDETFFQTLTRHLVPDDEIESRTLTFLMFSDYGMPVTFYNDHHDFLLAQDALFARKISPQAHQLKARLEALYPKRDVAFPVSGHGRALYGFLTDRGRRGRRFAARFWERESSLGPDRRLMILLCKKWHVGKRLAERIGQATGVPAYGYIFDELSSPLPDLGGIENRLEKRHRHRRALLRMLYDHGGRDSLVICLDPSGLALLQDFAGDRAALHVLEVDCVFSDEDILGHASRVGLVGPQTAPAATAELLPALRRDLAFESEQIRMAGFDGLCRLRETDGQDAQARALATFLGIAPGAVADSAALEHLFVD
ncbi:DUF5928 domain-containing protein [Cognatishimia sp. F0-27]|uniref:DUF5928 domain-containing protein n=1 Tax=Cognatishimia sp. F0-27 TaxID=2816855 RepID=UPI001D0CA4FC|nr:DUF5928 domain-containing protein [Cognatishimia sp. F0-27]MCC1491005.1 glycosyl transferase [Cognatishimia sp. F0-27]